MSDTPTSSQGGFEDLGSRDSSSAGYSSLGGGEVLAHGAPSPAGNAGTKRRRMWPFAVGGVAALAVGGAGVAFGMMVGGGGVQPEDVMPSSTLVYADIDFDPGADQKLNMMQLLHRFPDVEEELGDRDDIRAWLLQEMFSSSDLDADALEQWVGDRAGVGVTWEGAGTGPTFVLAIQVTDEAAARSTLDGEVEDDQLAFDQGYAVVTNSLAEDEMAFGVDEGQSAAEIVSSAQASSLADDADFRNAMDPLGSGLASAYMDGASLTDMVEDQMGGMMGLYQPQGLGAEYDGVTALVLKAEPNAFAVDGYSTETATGTFGASNPTSLVEGLPDSTMFALALTGGGEAATGYWETISAQMEALSGMGYSEEAFATDQISDSDSYFEREVAKFEAKYNVRIPEDIVTALGEDLVFAVDGEDLVTTPKVGLRSVTDPVAAEDLARRLRPMFDELIPGYPITIEGLDDGLVVASTPEYADELASASGGLLDDPRAQDALIDAESASAVMWVDFDEIEAIAGLADDELASALEPMSALGVTSVPEGDGWSVHARLTFDE